MAYRRSVFLINRAFQIRFCFYVCSWLLVLSAVYPIVIYNLFGYLIRYVSLDPFGPPLDNILKTRHDVIAALIALQIVFAAIIFILSVFISHRIAGPLFKLGRFLQAAQNGNFKERCVFRKTDHFPELAQQYNEMAAGLRGLFVKNAERATGAISRIESAMAQADPQSRKQLEGALTALREIQTSAQI